MRAPLATALATGTALLAGLALGVWLGGRRSAIGVSEPRIAEPRAGSEPIARSDDATAAALEALAREVRELRAAFEARPAPVPSPDESPVEPAPPNPVPDGAPAEANRLPTDEAREARDLVLELRALAAELRRELEATREALDERTTPDERIRRMREEGRAIDWAAWDEVLAVWRTSPTEAQAMVELLRPADLLERFGPPTDVWSNPLGLTWQYARDRDPATDAWRLEIILRLPEGYVTQMAVRGDY